MKTTYGHISRRTTVHKSKVSLDQFHTFQFYFYCGFFVFFFFKIQIVKIWTCAFRSKFSLWFSSILLGELQLCYARSQLWDLFLLTSYITGEKVLLAWVRWPTFSQKTQLTILIQSSSLWFIFPCFISSTIQDHPSQIIMLFCCVLYIVWRVSPMHLQSSLNQVQPNWYVYEVPFEFIIILNCFLLFPLT